jgi:hypothetical protein
MRTLIGTRPIPGNVVWSERFLPCGAGSHSYFFPIGEKLAKN